MLWRLRPTITRLEVGRAIRTLKGPARILPAPRTQAPPLLGKISAAASSSTAITIAGCGSTCTLAHWILRGAETAPAKCESMLAQGEVLVSSIDTLVKERGWWATMLRLALRCLHLYCMLAPVLATLPLLRSPLRAYWLRWLVATLERCGPVGIKWGQWASTRYDIFEDDLCDALGMLTNAAPVHPLAYTEAVMREELGHGVYDLFDSFSLAPIASGSIGQVYTAKLKHDHGRFKRGLKVAIKVQHPDLAERLGIDMAILMGVADALGSVKGVEIQDTVAQFASNFYLQLDFRDEADNLRRFASNFGSGFWSAIVSFPQPVDDLVNRHIVVETFERGESVADYLHKAGEAPKVTKWKRTADGWVPADPTQHLAARPNADGDDIELRKRVALCGVQSYLKMLMVDNFIHADLHPGNVLVRMEDVGLVARLQRYLLIGQWGDRVPHIVFLDAGLAASFNQRIYGNVKGFFKSIIDFDGPGFGDAILGLAPEQPNVKNPQAFRDEVTQKMADMKAERESGEGRAGDNIRSFMASVRAHHVKLDPTVMVALMSMMVLEGWQFRLDPATSIMGAIETQLLGKSSPVGWLLSFVR